MYGAPWRAWDGWRVGGPPTHRLLWRGVIQGGNKRNCVLLGTNKHAVYFEKVLSKNLHVSFILLRILEADGLII
jgi:hypothetical protein